MDSSSVRRERGVPNPPREGTTSKISSGLQAQEVHGGRDRGAAGAGFRHRRHGRGGSGVATPSSLLRGDTANYFSRLWLKKLARWTPKRTSFCAACSDSRGPTTISKRSQTFRSCLHTEGGPESEIQGPGHTDRRRGPHGESSGPAGMLLSFAADPSRP